MATSGGPLVVSVRVLIVDDNASKITALRSVLSPLGYTIVEADTGVEALRRVMEQDFAVILLDVRMPIMDGFETARLIRLRSQSETTPIIFITAQGSDDVANADRYAQGAVDFMFAPVSPDELRAKVSVFANLFRKAEALATRAREVQRSADQFRLLTNAAPIGIFQTDADNNYTYTNPRWSEISGIAAADAAGQPWDIILSSESRAGLTPQLQPSAAGRVEFCHRFEIHAADAEERIVVITSSAIPDHEGGTAGWVGTLADVTVEAGAEAAMSEARDQATAASVLKSDFLANMSHEIRTPMNGVIGMTELLLETDLNAQQRDYAQTVRNSGEALLTIINDILDFSKVEAGKLALEDIDFSARQIVGDVVDLLTGSATAKGLELVTSLDDSVPDQLMGDPGRVRQVLTNLIGNAIKFTHTGEVVVSVTGTKEDDLATFLRFEVSDTGDGIAPSKLDLIFQPFAQADTSTSRRYGGTGLGLAISSHLVTLMGGECGVTSDLGEGSVFWFTIRAGASNAVAGPRETSDRRALDGDPASATQSGAADAGRVLLVEDNLINQKVALAILTGAGYRVDTALNGALAVEAFSLAQYDAVLMDCQMPVLNGYEATAAMRAQEGGGRHTPIVAVTAAALLEDRQRCFDSGMDAFLAKPVRKDALLATLRRVTSGQFGPGKGNSGVDYLQLLG